ncbi:MAG: hypothetical protein IKS17_09785 [Firmicutes bacterium]|nr:hypothetical protein [Bacillota bacterium]
MDDSQYFDENIERAMSVFANLFAGSGKRENKMELIQAMLPLAAPQLSERLAPIIKAYTVNGVLQSYISLSKQSAKIKAGRRQALDCLRAELDPHSSRLLDLFIKFSEIKEIMEAI